MNIPKRFYQGNLPIADEVLFEVGVGKKTILKNIVLTNKSNVDAAVHFYIVPTGEEASEENVLIHNATVLANNTLVIDFACVLEAGDKVTARQIGENQINAYLSGLEVG